MTSFFSSRKANSSAPPPRIDNSSASFEPGMREGEETVVYRPKDAHSGRDGAEEAETGKRDPRYVNANSSSDILHVTQRKLANAEEQLVKLREENRRLHEHISALGQKYPNIQQSALELKRAQDRIQELEAINRQNTGKMESTEKHFLQLQRLLEQRTSELKEAQTYLNKPDEYPGSTILQSVERINLEIFNLATNIIDLFEEGKKTDLFERNEQRDVVDRCSRIARGAVGGLLYDFNCQIDEALDIRDPIVPESSVPLQLALQTILVAWTLEVFGTAGSLLDGHGELKDVYNLIQRQEEQSISSQWRAIAFRATKRLRKSFVNRAVERIMSVLIISGLSTTTESDYSQIAEKVAKSIYGFEEILLALEEIVRGGITSCDMDLVSVDAGKVFDTRIMADPYSTGSRPSDAVEEKVLCTVGLGLQRTTMKKTADKTFLPEIELLKRPEVVLESLLDDFKKPVDSEYGRNDTDSDSE